MGISLQEFFSGRTEFEFRRGIFYHRSFVGRRGFEAAYVTLRDREERRYTDDLLQLLPSVPGSHPHYLEWRIRSSSARKIINYLNRRKQFSTLLEVGCGNGWLTNAIQAGTGLECCGLDVNEPELIQAARVFSSNQNLCFIYGDIFTFPLPKDGIDVILLASALQYFDNPKLLLDHLISNLSPMGEIHIIDTPLYQADEVKLAKRRSGDYFAQMQMDEMNKYYFHHSQELFATFQAKTLYRRPKGIFRLLTSNHSPFPWVRITGKSLSFNS